MRDTNGRRLLLLISAGFLIGVFLPDTSGAAEDPVLGKTGTLTGVVLQEDQKTPVIGAVVRLRNLGTQKEYRSEPTKENGSYRISGIEEGYYAVGVSAPTGDFNLRDGLRIKGNEIAKLDVWLEPGGQLTTIESQKKRGFFNSTKGILGVAAATIGAIFFFKDNESEVSPVR